MTPTPAPLRSGCSHAADPSTAARELREALGSEDLALAACFAAPAYDRESLAGALEREFGDVPVIGCTTAGEISPAGFSTGSLTGFGLAAEDFEVELLGLEGLKGHQLSRTHEALASLTERRGGLSPERDFGLLLVDGLSTKEEELTGVLAEGLGEVPLFGGSAGDGLDFGTTGVLHAGRFASDRAVLALVRTRLPFHVFKTQHFVRGPRRMVVTEADASARVVKELCGLPAAGAYARALGLERDELTPEVFSTHPVVVRIGGQDYVRSIQSAQPDGSLLFYCAIDEGIIFRVAQGVGLVPNLEQALTAARAAVGDLAGVIGFDCILRRLEIEALSLQGEVDQLVRGHRVVGFSTYGEQFGAMHINQTFTGVALGHRGAA